MRLASLGDACDKCKGTILPQLQAQAFEISHNMTEEHDKDIQFKDTTFRLRRANAMYMLPVSGLSLLELLSTTEQTGTPGCNETNLLSRHSWACHGGRMANVLVISSSVRVLHRVHCRTSHLWPAVALHTVLVVIVASLQHRLVHAATTGHNANNGTACGGQALSAARWQTDASLLAIIRVAHHHAWCSGGTSKSSTVSCLLLAHGDHGTLRHLGQWQHISHRQLGLGATVDELTSVAALHGHPKLLLQLVAVRVMENNFAKWCSTSRVVHNVLDQALDVAFALSKVNCTKLHSTLPQPGLGCEDQGLTLTRTADDTAHGVTKASADRSFLEKKVALATSILWSSEKLR